MKVGLGVKIVQGACTIYIRHGIVCLNTSLDEKITAFQNVNKTFFSFFKAKLYPSKAASILSFKNKYRAI